jgi:hypothetical protein
VLEHLDRELNLLLDSAACEEDVPGLAWRQPGEERASRVTETRFARGARLLAETPPVAVADEREADRSETVLEVAVHGAAFRLTCKPSEPEQSRENPIAAIAVEPIATST